MVALDERQHGSALAEHARRRRGPRGQALAAGRGAARHRLEGGDDLVEVTGDGIDADEVLGHLAREVDDGRRDGRLRLLDTVHRAVPRGDGLVGNLPRRRLAEQPALRLDAEPHTVLAHEPAGIRVVGGDRRHVVEHGRAVLGSAAPRCPPRAASASRADSRSDSSPAALRVKVRPSTSSGCTRSLATSHTTRAAIVSVLPDPAPATTSRGRRGASMTATCSGVGRCSCPSARARSTAPQRGPSTSPDVVPNDPVPTDAVPPGAAPPLTAASPRRCAGQESLTWQVPHCEPGVAVKHRAGHAPRPTSATSARAQRGSVVGRERRPGPAGSSGGRGPAELQEGGAARAGRRAR